MNTCPGPGTGLGTSPTHAQPQNGPCEEDIPISISPQAQRSHSIHLGCLWTCWRWLAITCLPA